jgi:hypothetical protein
MASRFLCGSLAITSVILALVPGCGARDPDRETEERASETRSALTTISIVGRVTTPGGVLLPGLGVALNGSLQRTAVTDGNGSYLFQVPSGSYSLKPLKSGATFSPDVVNLNSITTDRIQDFVCSGACSGGPVVAANKELVISDPTVLGDIRASNAADGPWSFRFMMEQLTPIGTDPADFAADWVHQFELGTTVNGFNLQQRLASVLRSDWPTTPAGKLDLAQAPFRLLAIMNRVDLHAASNGEARFVYGLIFAGQTPQAMSVIFEFGLPARDPNTGAILTRASWASNFHALGVLRLGSSYNAGLQQVTDLFTRRNTSPEKPGGSSINQVRTNEIVLSTKGPWELRELHYTNVGGAFVLRFAETAQTPDDSANFSSLPAGQTLLGYVNGSAALIHGGYGVVPASVVGGEATEDFSWTLDPTVNPTARHDFAAQTCNGCHFSEIGNLNISGFYLVSPFADQGTDGTGHLSDFIKLFEIPRRTAFLQNALTCSGASCAAGGEPLAP